MYYGERSAPPSDDLRHFHAATQRRAGEICVAPLRRRVRPRVMSSMWEVDDAATAELMKRFYKGVLQELLTPAAALRAAQIEMLRKAHWQSPYYWGAFVLQGEWR